MVWRNSLGKALAAVVSWMLVVALCMAGLPALAFAQEPAAAGDETAGARHAGMWGSCWWAISDDGTLLIGEGSGASQAEGAPSPWAAYKDDIKRVRFTGTVSWDETVVDLNHLFAGLTALERVDGAEDGFSKLDTNYHWNNEFGLTGRAVPYSAVKSFAGMFEGCTALKSVNLTGLRSGGAADYSGMFKGCTSLMWLDMSALDTEVKDWYKWPVESFYTAHDNARGLKDLRGLLDGCDALHWVVTGDLWTQKDAVDAERDWRAKFPVDVYWTSDMKTTFGTPDFRIGSYRAGEVIPDGRQVYWRNYKIEALEPGDATEDPEPGDAVEDPEPGDAVEDPEPGDAADTSPAVEEAVSARPEALSESAIVTALSGAQVVSDGITYQVSATGTSVEFVSVGKGVKTAVIGDTVEVGGKQLEVTSVAPRAFKGCKKLKSVVLGANVETIGRNAFKGCKKLRSLRVNSTVLKSVAKGAFKGDGKLRKIKVPASKLKEYRMLFKKAGVAKRKVVAGPER